MKQISSKAMLITYANTMGKDLRHLDAVLDRYFPGVFGGIHILPFFPSSGDRGFAVINYDTVDPAFGTWEDIDRLADKYFLMADFMLNHVSIRCAEFQDYLKNGDASPYRDMFIHWDAFWPQGEPTQAELDAMYRRKSTQYLTFTRDDGKQIRIWNTFFTEQIDIDPYSKATQDYYQRNLSRLARHVPLIRFDAFAYASKRPGTTCFFVEPDIWKVLEIGMAPLKPYGTRMLPEIHENYTFQKKMADKGYWVYDFALPMLVLHALISGRSDRLAHWLTICPRTQFTTLDTHDGIGVVDVEGLLEDDEIELVQKTVDAIRAPALPYIQFLSTIQMSGKKAKRYQLGCTYYDACGSDDRAYLLARAVQLFTPGIPQIYYVGFLAGSNDIEALKRGEEPRSINRHTYTEAEIAEAARRSVVRQLMQLIRFRNDCPAFGGDIQVSHSDDGRLQVLWRCGNDTARLDADFSTKTFTITENDRIIYQQE